MDFIEIAMNRRTVRQFLPKEVEKEKKHKILQAGQCAPTAVNAKPHRIFVIEGQENLDKVKAFCTFGYSEKYAKLAKESAHKDEGKSIYYYGAPLVFLMCYDRNICWQHPESGESSGLVDTTIVCTHLMLEASSLGLGTVWISYFDKEKAREVFHIPSDYEITNMLYVGYPANDLQKEYKEKDLSFEKNVIRLQEDK